MGQPFVSDVHSVNVPGLHRHVGAVPHTFGAVVDGIVVGAKVVVEIVVVY